MSLTEGYLIIYSILICIIVFVGYIIYTRVFTIKFNDKRKPIKVSQNAYFSQTKIEKPQDIDIIEHMFLLASSLYEDAAKNNNYLILDYNIRYPRFFKAQMSNVIKLVDAMTQILLLNLSNSTISVKFILSSYHHNKTKFTISAWANKNIMHKYKDSSMINLNISKESQKFLNLAKQLSSQNGFELNLDLSNEQSTRIYTDIIFEISDTRLDLTNSVKIKKSDNFKVLIAEPNIHAFRLLKRDLDFLGLDVKPRNDWDNIKRHLCDTIFKPDLLFIQAEILKNLDFLELEKQLLEKNISLVIIKNKNYDFNFTSAVFTQQIKQPYTQDMLIKVLNNAYEHKNKQ